MNWFEIIKNTTLITLLIFGLMVVVELFELRYSGRLKSFFIENKSLKYPLSSLLGLVPGCSGGYLMDTLYMAGISGFGGLTATMITSLGDEAFYLISLSADPASSISPGFLGILLGTLFILGIIGGGAADFVVTKFNISVSKKCSIDKHVEIDFPGMQWGHFIKDHVWKHIFKKHIIKIFFWILAGLILMELLVDAYDLRENAADNMLLFLFLAGIIGIIPLSGPSMVIITFFSHGIIPFSVLLTNAIVHEGHGLLPLLGFSLEDSFKLKLYKLSFAYCIGLIVYAAGF